MKESWFESKVVGWSLIGSFILSVGCFIVSAICLVFAFRA